MDLDGDGMDDSRAGYPYSMDVPLSPTSGYFGPAFYGGFWTNGYDHTDIRLNDRKISTTQLTIRSQPSSPDKANHHGVFFIPKSEFAGIDPTDTLSFPAAGRSSLGSFEISLLKAVKLPLGPLIRALYCSNSAGVEISAVDCSTSARICFNSFSIGSVQKFKKNPLPDKSGSGSWVGKVSGGLPVVRAPSSGACQSTLGFFNECLEGGLIMDGHFR